VRPYRRRVSSEEEREAYVLVLKDRLSYFPPLGTAFLVVAPDGAAEVRVEAYDCLCRGPALPHQHYFIRRPGLRRGQTVTIERGANAYTLSVT
jgi:hypothetical protein